jgi:hypothetical protein
MKRGYQLIDPGLKLLGYESKDEQTRVLSYLSTNIAAILSVPPGIGFEVIPAQYTGDPYPAIGLFTERFVADDQELTRLSLRLERELRQHIREIGVERLLLLAADEELTWAEVLRRFGMRSDGTLREL